MIAYRDFHQQRSRPAFFSLGTEETTVSFNGAVKEANAWIAAAEVQIITIETVQPHEGGLPWPRVWYERFDANQGLESVARRLTSPESPDAVGNNCRPHKFFARHGS